MPDGVVRNAESMGQCSSLPTGQFAGGGVENALTQLRGRMDLGLAGGRARSRSPANPSLAIRLRQVHSVAA